MDDNCGGLDEWFNIFMDNWVEVDEEEEEEGVEVEEEEKEVILMYRICVLCWRLVLFVLYYYLLWWSFCYDGVNSWRSMVEWNCGGGELGGYVFKVVKDLDVIFG